MSDIKNEENISKELESTGNLMETETFEAKESTDNMKEDRTPQKMDCTDLIEEKKNLQQELESADKEESKTDSAVVNNSIDINEEDTSNEIDNDNTRKKEDTSQEMEIANIKNEENKYETMRPDAMAEDTLSEDNQYPKNAKELGKFCTKFNPEGNYFLSSKIPDICKKQPCILGIDEAGRGPVLGPMVYGICYCPKIKEDDLKETGCADSKSLTEDKRETIFEHICEHGEYIGWEVEVISPSVISSSMLRRQKVSLNEVSHNAAIGLVKRALEAGVMVTEIFVDTVGPAEKYQAKLKGIFPELSVTVAKKADSTYPIVGGASICAKVTRDVVLKSWTFSEINSSEGWGSGYPNDPVTQKFLLSTMDPVFGFPQLVRFSWSTAEKILEEKAVRVDWEDTEDSKGVPSVKSFFSAEDKKLPRFFKDRCLKNVDSL